MPIAWFGHPPPTATWIQNGEPVSPGGDRKIAMTTEPQPHAVGPSAGSPLEEEPGGTSVLRVPKASRVDSGEWQVVLKNEHGQTTSSCRVVVIGKENKFLDFLTLDCRKDQSFKELKICLNTI